MPNHQRRLDLVSRITRLCIKMKNNRHLIVLITAILLVFAIIQAAVPMGCNEINNEKNFVFADAWEYSLNNEAFCEVTLPAGINAAAGSSIILKNRLPAEMIKGATVLLRTSQQDAVVYVDDVNIYSSYDMEKNVHAPSSAYHFVRLPTDSAAKEITVVLSSPYENYAGIMNQFYIGSKASNVFFLFRENGLRFVTGFLIFSIGFLLMVMFLFAKGQGNQSAIIYLGAFFVCAGYWVIVESKMAQFIFPYTVALTNSSIFALTLLPVLSGLYYYDTHIKILKKAGKYVIITVAAASCLFSFATCISPALSLHVLPYYLFLMGLYVIAIFVSIVMESIKADEFFSASVCGMIAFGICCLLELACYLSNMNDYNESNILTVGLLLFCVAMAVDSIQKFTRVYQTSIKVSALSILAYTDSLTGLKNRTAFFENLSKINVDAETLVSFAVFDINNLKVVNDTLGHLAGDEMLRHSAKVIRDSIRQKDELYRIGGDEFVAIFRHDKDLNLSDLEHRMVSILERDNQKPLSYYLNIAYGYATFSKNTDRTLFETLARADENMYACKKQQKKQEIMRNPTANE